MSNKVCRFVLALVILTALVVDVCGETFSSSVIITRISDGHKVDMSEMIAAARRSDLVLIGESHDNMQHHHLQLSVIRNLWSLKVPMAIGVEMMEFKSQPELNRWIDGKLTEKQFVEVYSRNWTEPWSLYRDIFVFARDNHIPMVALNVPKELVTKTARQGFGSLSAEEKKGLPEGTTCDLNNPHTAFLRRSFREVFSHVTNGRVFDYFCEAQTLRNSGMAMNIDRYSRKHPGTKVVVLAGVWHAVKNAIPEQLERRGSKMTNTVILPDLPELDAKNATPDVVDYVVGR